MPSVVLADDWPGSPKGTVLTQVGQFYVNAGTGLRQHKDVVENDADRFLAPIAQNPTFFTANADGTTTQVTAASVADLKPNWFRSNARAQIVATRIVDFLKLQRSS